MGPRRLALRLPRVVVVAPHLDDAALSLGAAIARAARAGGDVTAVTVFAGDPDSTAPAGPWDATCGFASAADAARGRRAEDERACSLLGATPVWLPFGDVEYEAEHDADAVWAALAPALADAALVLAPGFPLAHPDHAWVARLLVERLPADAPLAFYVEQPYANVAAIGRGYGRSALLAALRIALRTPAGRRRQTPGPHDRLGQICALPLEWAALAAGRGERAAKRAAIRAYPSQVPHLGGRLLERIELYERGWGGEGVALPASRRGGDLPTMTANGAAR